MRRFIFIAEDSHGVRHNGNDARDRQLGNDQFMHSFFGGRLKRKLDTD